MKDMDCNGVDGFIVLICCRLHEYSVTELALVNMENKGVVEGDNGV